MIRLLFIVPYPALKDKVEYVLNNHPDKAELSSDIKVLTVDRIPHIDARQYDAVIARGFSAKRLRQEYSALPVIDLAISGYDIFRTVAECHKYLGAQHIAVCGFYGKLYEAQSIGQLLDCQVSVYPSDNLEELTQNIQHAQIDGCDAIIGGYSAAKLAANYNLPCRLIQTGEDTVQQAVGEAIRLIRQVRAERVTAETYKTIIYASKDGILYVDDSGVIQLRNRVVKEMNAGISLHGKSLKNTLPYLYRSYRDVLKLGQEISGQIVNIQKSGITASVSFVPVMADGTSPSGVVITLSDITRIRSLENKIRRSLVEKGLRAKYTFADILHESSIIDDTIALARKYAASDSNISIVGETGTGKELFAQSIHNESPRKNGPFVAINCAALPENLLESELFGYVEGAFTGTAKGGKMGLFEQANGGTLFLDEIAEISPSTQSKLLRVLQEREVRRIGGDKVISVDVRIISATNKSISRLAEQGEFRRDLMYRLDVLRLFIPPLRKRGKDASFLFLRLLQQHYTQSQSGAAAGTLDSNAAFSPVKRALSVSHSASGSIMHAAGADSDVSVNLSSNASGESKLPVPKVAPDALSALLDYPFNGNIRELRNIVERTAAICTGGIITKTDMLAALYPPNLEEPADVPVRTCMSKEQEKNAIVHMLHDCGGNQSRAARLLGMDRSTLWRKMKKFGIQAEE